MADKHPLESDELAEAYNILGRPGVPLKAKRDAVLTVLTLEWAHELLARRPEAQARKEEIQAANDRQKEEIRLRVEHRERALAEQDARAAEEHERKMHDDPLYAMQWRREHPRR